MAMFLNESIGMAVFSLLPISWVCFGCLHGILGSNALFCPDSCFWLRQKQIFFVSWEFYCKKLNVGEDFVYYC